MEDHLNTFAVLALVACGLWIVRSEQRHHRLDVATSAEPTHVTVVDAEPPARRPYDWQVEPDVEELSAVLGIDLWAPRPNRAFPPSSEDAKPVLRLVTPTDHGDPIAMPDDGVALLAEAQA